MVRPRFHDLAEDRREQILEAAATEFSDLGYDSASVNRIATRAGISKGSLYYYFDDKEDVFATVMEHAFTRMLDRTGSVDPGGLTATTFWNAYRDLMRRTMQYMAENEWHVRLARSFHRLRQHAPDSPAVQRVMRSGRGLLEAILARGQDLGVVRTDLPLDLLVDVTMAADEAADRWLLQHWSDLDPDTRLQHADVAIDLVRDMLHAKNQGWEEDQ